MLDLEREAADLRDPGALCVEVFLSRDIRSQSDLAGPPDSLSSLDVTRFAEAPWHAAGARPERVPRSACVRRQLAAEAPGPLASTARRSRDTPLPRAPCRHVA